MSKILCDAEQLDAEQIDLVKGGRWTLLQSFPRGFVQKILAVFDQVYHLIEIFMISFGAAMKLFYEELEFLRDRKIFVSNSKTDYFFPDNI